MAILPGVSNYSPLALRKDNYSVENLKDFAKLTDTVEDEKDPFEKLKYSKVVAPPTPRVFCAIEKEDSLMTFTTTFIDFSQRDSSLLDFTLL
ncbi:unnamed protein product [Trifolium pratense]|uniref:Uncharacterized protein n=1 Tax=Trifolium pratense TaxID=57577 RepID=A0ACB0L7M0_TRIPR|nr:unnamed protein product [Trifolium pratense]